MSERSIARIAVNQSIYLSIMHIMVVGSSMWMFRTYVTPVTPYVFRIDLSKFQDSGYRMLTAGALAKICEGQEVADPVLQVLGIKPFQGSSLERSLEANTFSSSSQLRRNFSGIVSSSAMGSILTV